MPVSVVLHSGECVHATLAIHHGLNLYADKHLHLSVGEVVHLAGPHAETLAGIPIRHQVISATQVVATRIYRLQPV